MARRVALTLAFIATLAGLTGTASATTTITPSHRYMRLCETRYHGIACDFSALHWINVGRRSEGLPIMHIPKGSIYWGTPAQMRWIVNSERRVRGLPERSDSTYADSLARVGAIDRTDPVGPAGYDWGANYSGGFTTALAANFEFMYDDGPGSPNIGCTATDPAGCWGHRRNVLMAGAGVQGAAVADNAGVLWMTELLVTIP